MNRCSSGLRQSERLAVTVLYYGAVVTDPDLLRPLTDGQPVLGVFGAEDQQIFVEDVIEFETALNSLDIPNQITDLRRRRPRLPDRGELTTNQARRATPGRKRWPSWTRRCARVGSPACSILNAGTGGLQTHLAGLKASQVSNAHP